MSKPLLPPYSPGTDTPQYTFEPGADEERLQIGRVPTQREQSGVFVGKTKHVTIALTNQTPNCKEPTYGKGAIVEGCISPINTEGVLRIEVKLEAVLTSVTTSIAMAGEKSIPLFSKEEVLFDAAEAKRARRETRSQTPEGAPRCPSTMPFAIRIPTVYSHEGNTHPLPPSYFAHLDSIPGFTVDSRYTLSIKICKKGPLGRDKKTVHTQSIVYTPRSRPSQPALPPSLQFLSTMKSSPEEWKLFESETKVRESHKGIPTITSALLIPQQQVYPITHPIPFHLQLSSTSARSLSSFMNVVPNDRNRRPKELADAPGSSSDARIRAENVKNSSMKNPGRIIISVQRHVAVQCEGEWLKLKMTLSTSTSERRSIRDPIQEDAGRAALAWEGQIHVKKESRCAGFIGPGVKIHDFILLSVVPPELEHSPLQEIRQLIPIRLTTDPYSDDMLAPGMELTY